MRILPTALMTCILILSTGPAPVAAACMGDCNDDGQVTVDELILGINIALGDAGVEQCTAIDTTGDGTVTVDEIVGAVNAALAGCSLQEPRLIVLSREGRIASLDIVAPWSVRASGDLGTNVGSARCRAGRCLVVHPSTDSISVVDALDLSTAAPITLERRTDPRDVALVDDHTAVISQYGSAELVVMDLDTHAAPRPSDPSGSGRNGRRWAQPRAKSAVDLSALADEDGLPESLRLANCGRRVFVQLQRIDHGTGVPASIGAALAVIDLDRPADDRIVDADPNTAGLQGIALAARPNFDMTVDCEAGLLYVVEPAPLMQGGGGFEVVDLDALVASEFPIDPGAQLGGFQILNPEQYWLITHTEIGPGPSSHLNLFGGTTSETHNTFSAEHVDDVAFDAEEDLLFYPDPCGTLPPNQTCDGGGVFVFHAHTGESASAEAIDVGFQPIEVVVSR